MADSGSEEEPIFSQELTSTQRSEFQQVWRKGGGGGTITEPPKFEHIIVAIITPPPPFFNTDTFDINLLLIVCALR